MSEAKKRWYVVYTKPRWEKKVYGILLDNGVDAYCPLNRVKKKWSDRFKWVDEPLFKSYVFVHVDEGDQTSIRMINGVLNFVYWLGKPAIVKQVEIDRIKRFLNEYENVIVEPMELQPDEIVVVTAGAFMEKEGKVLKRAGNNVSIEIASLGFRLVVQVDKKNVIKKRSISANN